MKKIIIIFAMSLVVFCNCEHSVLKWRLNTEFEFQSEFARPADIDDDGIDELIIKERYIYLIRNQKGTIMEEILLSDTNYIYVQAADLDNKLPQELIFQDTRNDSVFISIAEKNKIIEEFFLFFGKDISPPPGYKGGCAEITASDLNGDGFKELVCFIRTGYDVKPRGVLVYDNHNKRELWHTWVGGNPYAGSCFSISTDDTSRFRDKRIVFGTAGHCNGGFANGIDDSSSYAVAMNDEGKIVWKKRIGDISTVALPQCIDIDQNGQMDVVVIEEQGLVENTKPNSLFILDGKSGKIERYINTGEKFNGMAICDINRDGRLEIITGNTDGNIRVFNDSLNLIQEKSLPFGVKVISACDFDGDGTNEILVVGNNSRFYVLNERLKIILDESVALSSINPSVYIVHCSRRKKILFRTNDNTPYTYKLMSFAPVVPSLGEKSSIAVTVVILALVLGGAFFLICYFLRSARKVRNIRKAAEILPYVFVTIDGRDRITYMNDFARKVFGMKSRDLGKESVDILVDEGDRERFHSFLKAEGKAGVFRFDSKKEGVERNLEARMYPFNGERILIAEDKTSKYLSEKLVSWAGFAQRLAHEVKNPLSTITLTLQRLQSLYRKEVGKGVQKLDSYTDSILEEVERLRVTTDRFMKFLSIEKPVFELNDLNALLDDVLDKYEEVLPKEVEIKRTYDKELPAVNCDGSQVRILLTNLIENALEALGGNGVLSVKTLSIEKLVDSKIKKYSEITIEDTGKGIRERDLKNLFIPFYTTKEGGTGLGLLICRQIVELHKGEINIESKEGIGTTVTVILPINKNREKRTNRDEMHENDVV